MANSNCGKALKGVQIVMRFKAKSAGEEEIDFIKKAIAGGNWTAGPGAYAPPRIPKITLPRFKTPSFKMPKSPLPKMPAKPFQAIAAKPAAAPPVNHLNTAGMADGIGGDLHEVQSRIHTPTFGRPQVQHAHLMSHRNPSLAIHAIHAHIASQGGQVGAITEQRVPHAIGGMAHLYSFEHTDSAGAKHMIHMTRSMPAKAGLKPKKGASPLGQVPLTTSPAA